MTGVHKNYRIFLQNPEALEHEPKLPQVGFLARRNRIAGKNCARRVLFLHRRKNRSRQKEPQEENSYISQIRRPLSPRHDIMRGCHRYMMEWNRSEAGPPAGELQNLPNIPGKKVPDQATKFLGMLERENPRKIHL